VQLREGELTASTAKLYEKDFRAIRAYLSANARLIFYSCVAGQGRRGSALLNELSHNHFPGRHVIGFERFGVISGMGQAAGEMWCADSTAVSANPAARVSFCSPTATLKPVSNQAKKTEQILSEYSIYAKWSYNGDIIKLPYDEINRRIESVARVICGPKEVERKLKDPVERAQIDHIAIKTANPTRDIQRLFTLLQESPYNFKWGVGLRELTAGELSKLPRVPGKSVAPSPEGIVAFYKKKVTWKYKCANPDCRSHGDVKDYCTQFVKAIPNGPLV
jgi:hypothetical protein